MVYGRSFSLSICIIFHHFPIERWSISWVFWGLIIFFDIFQTPWPHRPLFAQNCGKSRGSVRVMPLGDDRWEIFEVYW